MHPETVERIREKIKAGETVTPAALLKAKATDELSEIVASVEQEQHEADLEAKRVARISELVEELESGSPDELGAILDAYDKLTAANAAIATAVETYGIQLTAKVKELASLKPLPDGVYAKSVGAQQDVRLPSRIQWPQPSPMLTQLIAEAAWPHIPDHKKSLFSKARGRTDYSVLDPIRKAIKDGRDKQATHPKD